MSRVIRCVRVAVRERLEGRKRQWFSLEIQLRTNRYTISVSLSNFRNSAVRSEEFQKYFETLRSQNEGHDDSLEEIDEESGAIARRTALYDCFDWAVTPCLDDFERHSPALPPLEGGQLTLGHFIVANSFECDLNAIDDVLLPGEIEPAEPEDLWFSAPSGDSWTTSFPSFTPTEISVHVDDPENPFDSNPSQVCFGQQRLYFKEISDLDDTLATKEVEKYERIARAGLGTDVRTSRLYGVVRNERKQLAGLLLYPIEEEDLLTFAAGPDTPDALKNRWAQQIQHTIAALHKAGIIWGDAKPDNILIDVHGDAWVIDFGGGRTEGWVDADKAGTTEGDLQGLERILKFIASGDYDRAGR
ncbi:hypothetical protein B0J18DRAFT_450404 [Chaetomium sp. MPI-SDFR-AT-0129]|nr:hypothetical protein B0J18DRAFT_450404 [Chaetomium sp. MPI-SDFR-AT-0129]